jgi:hypothetical protein
MCKPEQITFKLLNQVYNYNKLFIETIEIFQNETNEMIKKDKLPILVKYFEKFKLPNFMSFPK